MTNTLYVPPFVDILTSAMQSWVARLPRFGIWDTGTVPALNESAGTFRQHPKMGIVKHPWTLAQGVEATDTARLLRSFLSTWYHSAMTEACSKRALFRRANPPRHC